MNETKYVWCKIYWWLYWTILAVQYYTIRQIDNAHLTFGHFIYKLKINFIKGCHSNNFLCNLACNDYYNGYYSWNTRVEKVKFIAKVIWKSTKPTSKDMNIK